MQMMKFLIIFLYFCYSVQLVGFIAMSLSTTKVFSHNLVWLHKTRSCSPSLSPSQSIPTGQTSLTYLTYKNTHQIFLIIFNVFQPFLSELHSNNDCFSGHFFPAVWLPWLWRTAKLAASQSVRSIALWRITSLISRYATLFILQKRTEDQHACSWENIWLIINFPFSPCRLHLMDGRTQSDTTCP